MRVRRSNRSYSSVPSFRSDWLTSGSFRSTHFHCRQIAVVVRRILRNRGRIAPGEVIGHVNSDTDRQEHLSEIDEDEEPFFTGNDRSKSCDRYAEKCIDPSALLHRRNEPRHKESDDDSGHDGKDLIHDHPPPFKPIRPGLPATLSLPYSSPGIVAIARTTIPLVGLPIWHC